jgi:hypothetical protein
MADFIVRFLELSENPPENCPLPVAPVGECQFSTPPLVSNTTLAPLEIQQTEGEGRSSKRVKGGNDDRLRPTADHPKKRKSSGKRHLKGTPPSRRRRLGS